MQIEELEVQLNNMIIEAYAEGMSIVEITRTLGEDRVEFVHRLIRFTKLIPAMEPGDRRVHDIDYRLIVALKMVGYSFGRWCMGWNFDPDTTKAIIKDMPGEGTTTLAHEAIRRDFPSVYYRIFGGTEPSAFEESSAMHHSGYA